MEPISRFKVIIAGSRSYDKGICYIHEILEELCIPVNEVVCGMAIGADLAGKAWAEDRGIPIKEFPANWSKYGKRAGILRNIEMGDYADELVALWDGKSRGTKHMIDYMTKLGKPTHVHYFAV